MGAAASVRLGAAFVDVADVEGELVGQGASLARGGDLGGRGKLPNTPLPTPPGPQVPAWAINQPAQNRREAPQTPLNEFHQAVGEE
jgi:hypothetical protein